MIFETLRQINQLASSYRPSDGWTTVVIFSALAMLAVYSKEIAAATRQFLLAFSAYVVREGGRWGRA